MAAIILPGRMRVQPSENAVLDLGNPLLVGVREVVLPQRRRTLVQGNPTVVTGAVNFGGAAGGVAAISPSNLGNLLTVGSANANHLFAATECTIFLVRRHIDTSLRNCANFGFDLSSSNRVLIAAPYSDGNCYWDYGGTSTTQRLSVAWTKSTKVEALVFVAGSVKGREIWRNGVKVAGDNTKTGTASPTGADVSMFGNQVDPADLEEQYLVGIVARAWSDAEIEAWSQNPWQVFRAPRKWWLGPVAATTNVALTGVSATGSVGSIVANHANALTHVTATGSVGTVTALVGKSFALTGVSATGSVGSAKANHANALTHVTATGSVGALKPTIGITGVSAAGSVGSAKANHANALTHVTATGSVGTVVAAAGSAITITGVTATGSVGSLHTARTLALTQAAAAALAGTIQAAHVVSILQVSGSGSVGAVHYEARIAVAGNLLHGSVGYLTRTRELSGVQAWPRVGSLGVGHVISLTGVSASTAVGATIPKAALTLTGVTAAGLEGFVGIGHTVAASQVSAAGHVGTLSGGTVLKGVTATSHSGNVAANVSIALRGVAAAGAAGRIGVPAAHPTQPSALVRVLPLSEMAVTPLAFVFIVAQTPSVTVSTDHTAVLLHTDDSNVHVRKNSVEVFVST